MQRRVRPFVFLFALAACNAQQNQGGADDDERGAGGRGGAEDGDDSSADGRGGRGSGGQAGASSAAGVAGSGGQGSAAAGGAAGGSADGGNAAGQQGGGGQGGQGGNPAGGASAGGGGNAETGACPDGRVCVDFEDGELPSGWEKIKDGDSVNVETSRAKSGTHSLHYKDLKARRPKVRIDDLGRVGNVLWGRMYLYVTPAAPEGHGALIAGFDQDDNWYEVGFQFRNYHGNYHPGSGGGERWMNSKVLIPKAAWTCVEWQFDGAKPDVTQIWSDAEKVPYSQAANGPGPYDVQAFDRLEIGFTPYHGSDMTDMWIDDVAIDSERIGCEP